MPPKFKKLTVKKSKSNIVRRKRKKFPNEKIVALNLAKCVKESFLDMITKIEISRQGKSKEKEDSNINQAVKSTDEDGIMSASKCITAGDSLTTSYTKKKRHKKMLKGKGKKFQCLGRRFIKTFKYFSRQSDRYAPGNAISYSKTLRWLKQAGVLDNHKVTIRDVETHFINQLKSGYELKILEFIRFLKSLTEDRGLQMSTVVTNLLKCHEEKSTFKKSPVLYKKKINGAKNLNSVLKKNATSKLEIKHRMRKLYKGDTTKVKTGKENTLISEMQSAEDLIDNYAENNKGVNEISEIGLRDLKLHSSLLKSEDILSFKKPIVVQITPALKSIPFENKDFEKDFEKPLFLEVNSKINSDIRHTHLPNNKRNEVINEKQKHSSVSVNLNAKHDLQKNSQKIVLKGISLTNNDDENYEYITETTSDDEIMLPAKVSSNEFVYREKSPSLKHSGVPYNTIPSSTVTGKDILENRKSVVTKKTTSSSKGEKNKVTKATNSVNRQSPSVSNTMKFSGTNTIGMISIENINPEMKDRGNLKNDQNISKTPKRAKINSSRRFDYNFPNTSKNSTVRICINSVRERVKRRNDGNPVRIETRSKIFAIDCEKKHPQSTKLRESFVEKRRNQTNKQNISKIPFKITSWKDIKTLRIENSEEVKRIDNRKNKNQRTFTNLPIKTKSGPNSIYTTDIKNPKMIRSFTNDTKKKAKETFKRLKTKNKSVSPLPKNNSSHFKELLNSNLEFKNSPTRNPRNNILNNIKFPDTKNVLQGAKSRASKSRRTFTNLPVRQVQKALSSARKLKLNNRAPSINASKNNPKSKIEGKNLQMKVNLKKRYPILSKKEKDKNIINESNDINNDLMNDQRNADVYGGFDPNSNASDNCLSECLTKGGLYKSKYVERIASKAHKIRKGGSLLRKGSKDPEIAAEKQNFEQIIDAFVRL